MKRVLPFIFLLSAVLSPVYALHVKCVGAATQVVNHQTDTLFFFAGEVQLATTDGSLVDWYRISDGALVQSAASEIYPDDGGYYIIYNGTRENFYAFSYPAYQGQDLTLTATPQCHSTQLTLSGTLPAIRYVTPAGETRTYGRTCRISFTNLTWNSGELQWVDTAVVMDGQTLHLGTYELPAIYCATDIGLSSGEIAATLGLASDSVTTHLTTPVAVSSMPTSTTTVRGTAGELSNEVERPTDASVLTGSAPLEILFKANPTPTAEYYEWRIYKAAQLIVSRTDEQTRYTFNEPGNYRAVSYVSNSLCPCGNAEEDCMRDSTEITIAVSESMLLVPNVFTPNGDGKNDEFRVLYRSLKEFHCWVYNRWGKLVYEWTDPARGWDGTINGKPAAEGAYFYVIRALGTDAAADGYRSKTAYKKAKDKADESIIGVYQLSGDINLLRGK